MALKVSKADVWHGEIADEPGSLDRILGALSEAGADLDTVIARRQPDQPGTGVVFVTPVKGKKVVAAAQSAGLNPAQHIATLRVEGPDKPGAGQRITQAIAGAAVNMRGVTAAVVGSKFVAYLAFDSGEDADKAAKALRAVK